MIEDKENRFFAIPRFGDLDLDGKNDLVLNVTKNNKNQTIIFFNRECDKNTNVNKELCRHFDNSKTEK